MKKALKRSLSLLLAITIIFGSMYVGLGEVDFSGINLSGLFAVKAKAAQYTGSCGTNVTYSLNTSTYELVISGTGTMTDYSTSSQPWYSNRAYIKTVTINSGVTSIGKNAFKYCYNLKTINISDSVTSIGEDAFGNCQSISSISVDSANACYTTDGYGVLFDKNKTNLIKYPSANTRTTYTIPSSVTSISNYAFWECDSITGITIPSNVKSIGVTAFGMCSNLSKVTLNYGLTTICDSAFSNCTSLTSISIPDSVTTIGSSAFYNTGYYKNSSNWENNALYIGKFLVQVDHSNIGDAFTIKSGTKLIAGFTFLGCSALATVTIPDSVAFICDSAFYDCSAITTCYYAGAKEQWDLISIGKENKTLTSAQIIFDCNSDRPNYGSGSCGDGVTWTVYTDGELVISGAGDMNNYGSLNMPWKNLDFNTVTIGGGVTSIGAYAFYKCSKVYSVTIPSGMETIGVYAFYGCNGLTNVVIPNSVTSIGEYAFYDCAKLYSVTMSGGVETIGECAFYSCENLGKITIPNSLTSVSYSAFEGCLSLNSVYITDIAAWCAIEFIDSSSNPLCFAGNLYLNNSRITELAIPDGVTSIGNYAFSGCTGLTSVTISNSVKNIGNGAFSRCTGLTSVTIPDTVTSIDYGVFQNCTSLTSVIIPDGVTSIGGYAFKNCTSLTSVAIPNSVTNIGNSVFSNCTSLTSVIIPDGVTSIGEYAFKNCTSLTSVTIPENVRLIGREAFYDTGFYNNENNWVDNVLYIGKYLIDAKTSISGAYTIKTGTKTIACEAFGYCSSLTSVTIPDTVTSIDYGVFRNCTSLAEVAIPKGVTSIGDYAFSGCQGLMSLVIPDGVTNIGDSAFYGCKSLISLVVPNGVTNIGEYAFAYCSNLTSIELPEGLTEINYYLFYNCESLANVTIPRSVTSIQQFAFYPCYKLSNIFYRGLMSEWNEIYLYVSNKDYINRATIRHLCTCGDDGVITQMPSCTADGVIERTCVVCSKVNKFSDFYYSLVVDSSLYPESAHNYGNYASETYNFRYDGANSLTLKFSSSTATENNCDYIYIYDANGTQYGKYSGTTLAGKTITLQGDSFSIKLTSDGSVNKYGFSFDSIEAEIEAKALGHKPSGDWITDIEPTCKTEGSKYRVCERCGEKADITVVETTGIHSCGDWVVTLEPTCVESGSRYRICSVCEEQFVEEILATGHQNTMWVTEKEPTCTLAGYKDEYCLDCGDLINTEEILATGHQNTMWVTEKEPTCTIAGYKDEYCLDCGDLVNTEEIPATGHSCADWIIDVAPTCTESGSKHQICSACEENVTEAIPSLGHNYSEEWTTDVVPTCTEEGSKSHHCIACGGKTDITVVESLGHSYSEEWTIDLAPSCTEVGSKSHHCTACGDKADITEVEALGHIYSEEWTIDLAPTCTEEGSKSHHCIACYDDVADVTVIEPLGHDFKVVSVVDEHPHTTTFDCSRCPETKEEETFSEKCGVCNFSYTNVDDETCKISGYVGNSTTMFIPATINGRTVATTTTGAFKNNTTLTSVTIENGVQGLGALAFLGCKSLSKVVIPESVTSIGENAFYNCASDFTIYCYRDTYAMQYAIDNSLNYVIMDISETEDSIIDYENKLIFLLKDCVTSLDDILYVPSSSMAFAEASHISGDNEFLGTGSIVTVFDGNDISSEYTVIVEGDTNGDSVCDVLDTLSVAKVSNGHTSFDGAYAIAADSNQDEVIDINDYQAIVNKAVS